jgi:hypothetical protein
MATKHTHTATIDVTAIPLYVTRDVIDTDPLAKKNNSLVHVLHTYIGGRRFTPRGVLPHSPLLHLQSEQYS